MKYRLFNLGAWLLAVAVVILGISRYHAQSENGRDIIHIGNHAEISENDSSLLKTADNAGDSDAEVIGNEDFEISFSDLEDRGRIPEAVSLNDSGAVMLGQGHYRKASGLFIQAVSLDTAYARAYYNLALTYHRLGKVNDAIREYSRSHNLRSDYYPPIYNLGVLYFTIGEFAKAKEWLERAVAIKRSADVASAYYNLGLVYRRLGDESEARRDYLEAIRLRPGYIEARYNLAILYMSADKFADAIGEFEKAAALGLNKARLFYNLGVCYGNLNEYDKAIAAYRKAIAHDSLKISAWYNLAINMNNAGQKEEAIKAYQHLLLLDSSFVKAHFNLALLFADNKTYGSAIMHYRIAAAIEPSYSKALYNLAHLFSDLDQADSAAVYYERVIDLDPENTPAMFNLGLIYTRLEMFEDAAQVYLRLVDIDPVNDKALNNLGTTFLELEEYDSAYVYFNRLVRLTGSPKAYYNRAKVGLRKKDYGQASSDFKKAIELDPNYFSAYHNLAVSEERAGRVEEAIKILEKLINMGDAGWRSYWKLGQLYRDQGMVLEAFEQFKLARQSDPRSESFNQEYEELRDAVQRVSAKK